MLDFQYNDGGRAAAGYKGLVGDCVVRAIAIAAELPYQDIYHGVRMVAQRERPRVRGRSCPRNGVYRPTFRRYLAMMGWRWVSTSTVGQVCRVRLRADELPRGRLIVRLSAHIAAVIDGVLHDVDNHARDGTRRVYGYWLPPL